MSSAPGDPVDRSPLTSLLREALRRGANPASVAFVARLRAAAPVWPPPISGLDPSVAPATGQRWSGRPDDECDDQFDNEEECEGDGQGEGGDEG